MDLLGAPTLTTELQVLIKTGSKPANGRLTQLPATTPPPLDPGNAIRDPGFCTGMKFGSPASLAGFLLTLRDPWRTGGEGSG